MPLSCCIITKNESDRIERCIVAVRDIVDEIVVVDSGSEDDTVAKATTLGARVFFNAWDGFGPQKRYAEDRATHDWILSLDADEVVTPELAQEIAALMCSPDDLLPAYRFRQVMVYPGHDRPRLWADSHNYVRLYDRRRVRFRSSLVHDTVDTGDHPVGQLKGIALHHSWRTLEHARRKLDAYFELQLQENVTPIWFSALRLLLDYPREFARYYFVRRHMTGGLFGLRLSHLCAASRLRRLLSFLRQGLKTSMLVEPVPSGTDNKGLPAITRPNTRTKK
jgi:glycosyltransferase involved in cell wall biosynthesis